MSKEENLKKLEEWILKTSAYETALAILHFDKTTIMPKAGTEFRDKRMAYLAGEAFTVGTDPEIIQVLKELKEDETLDEETKRAVNLYYKDVMDIVCIPKDEYVAMTELMNSAYSTWVEAKQNDDYALFEPYLKKVIEAIKKVHSYRDSDLDIYDQMLDDFEPGMNQEKYDAFFGMIKERLVPFIKKVTEAKQINTDFIHQNYPKNLQREFMNELLEYLHFDSSWGYQSETEHPFTTWSNENDVRTTTRYIENNLTSAILSTIHEVGHATYEHDIDDKYDGMILSEGVSSGMHESQSRLVENYLGRTKAFWEANYPKLKEKFPEQLKDTSLDDFVNAINKSEPSFIRTEADELTYPLHVLIRYEIEKGLFNGTISTEGLNETWKKMYKEYLGVDVPNDQKGILQDVHWSEGNFGYFPTYALGSAYAAQFVEKMRSDIDVDAYLRNSQFDKIVDWLKENIHQYGCRYTAEEVMVKATGKPFDINIYIDYLIDKYSKLYNL